MFSIACAFLAFLRPNKDLAARFSRNTIPSPTLCFSMSFFLEARFSGYIYARALEKAPEEKLLLLAQSSFSKEREIQKNCERYFTRRGGVI